MPEGPLADCSGYLLKEYAPHESRGAGQKPAIAIVQRFCSPATRTIHMLWLLREKMIGRLGPCASALILGMTLLPIFSALAANASDERENVGVACLGRILPEDGIFHISAPYNLQGPSLIAQVLVKEGDWVKKDQVLAATRSRPIAEAACAEAKSQVEVARARLAQVQAGEKASDIAAQEAEVQRSNADFRDAEQIFNRNLQLRKTGAVSEAELDHSRSTFDGRRNQMESATKKLASIREVRKTDVNYAAAQVTAAIESQPEIAALEYSDDLASVGSGSGDGKDVR